jgi:hypothetical protein
MLTFDNFKSRIRGAFDVLEDARKNARLIRILTSITEYENMLIEQVLCTRSPEDGSGAHFTIALKEIEKVSSDVTVAPEPAELSGTPRKAAGSKNAKEDEAKVATLKKSLLARALDAGSDFLNGGLP